ncbi:MAG TPA: metallophosphoesterase [Longimicrobium sp.]|nr:metallophosphoesterase [Longimicrobium sp.]
MRIYAISDVHADFRENRRLLERIPAHAHRGDALIVAGDVADSLAVMSDTLAMLRERFAQLFFVPGNHELWVRGDSRDSLEKFQAVLDACRAVDVHTAPARAGGAWVVPLFSWYDPSFDVAGEGEEDTLEAWSDRYFCRWPAGVERVDRHFLALNEPHVRRYDAPVVSFSHFVPRTELLPPVRWLRFKGLPLVAGSVEIDAQVRRLGAAVHVYGHTHIPGDQVLHGVRYVQNHLRESGSGEGGLLHRVWDDGADAAPGPLFC